MWESHTHPCTYQIKQLFMCHLIPFNSCHDWSKESSNKKSDRVGKQPTSKRDEEKNLFESTKTRCLFFAHKVYVKWKMEKLNLAFSWSFFFLIFCRRIRLRRIAGAKSLQPVNIKISCFNIELGWSRMWWCSWAQRFFRFLVALDSHEGKVSFCHCYCSFHSAFFFARSLSSHLFQYQTFLMSTFSRFFLHIFCVPSTFFH